MKTLQQAICTAVSYLQDAKFESKHNLTFWQTFPMVFLRAVNTHEHILKQTIIIPSSNILFNSPFNITLLLNAPQPTLRKKCSRHCRALRGKSNCWLLNFMHTFTKLHLMATIPSTWHLLSIVYTRALFYSLVAFLKNMGINKKSRNKKLYSQKK